MLYFLLISVQGLTDAALESELPGIELADKVSSINLLLVKRRLQIFKNGDSLVYKEVRPFYFLFQCM